MKLSRLNELPITREMIDVFGGYNHNLRIRDGEFYDMTNLTSAHYPVLSPRPKRGIYAEPTNPLGMISKDSLCYVDGKTLYINEKPIESLIKYEKCDACPNRANCNNYEASKTRCEKTMISMGAYIIVMPDKVYFNTENHSDKGNIEQELVAHTGMVKFNLCKADGVGYENISSTAPESPQEGDLWLDQSSSPVVLKQYSKSTGQWSSVATTYVKITFSGSSDYNLDSYFSEGDGVAISGITEHMEDEGESSTKKEELLQFENTMVVNAVGVGSTGGGYIVVKGIISANYSITVSEDKPITISRTMPYMDFIIESQNRLWGCRYGKARNGQIVNEIYASKLGDFKNWDSFAGISTDSYVASVGTDGQFTGAVTHMGYPLFFKENCMHKVYGNFPSNYQIQTTACRGVQKGCSKSLAIVNETLFYKARSAVCAYDGSLPVEMSSEFGEIAYENAVAGSLGNKYYISMADSDGQYHLLVYDAVKGMWHREDNTQAVEFCNCRGDLYYIDYADNKIKTVRGTGDGKEPTSVRWMATTGILCTDSPDKKYISRLTVRLSLEVGTRVHFSIEYDSSGTFEHLYTMTGTSLRSFSVPIRPKRCDHMRLRIDGDGEAKIYSICKTIEQGSDA